MNRYEITFIHSETREEVHSFTWGTTATKAAKRVLDQMKEDRETWSGWMLEIKVPNFN